jgi:hypothetical protein
MRPISYIFSAVVLAAFIAGGVYLLLPACGVRLPLIGTLATACAATPAEANAAALRAAEARNLELTLGIAALERELAIQHCVPAQAAVTPVPPPEAGIDREAWEAGDLGLLEGCWRLDSNYETVNRQTGVRTSYTEWELCFGTDGAGRETMRAVNGTTCEGPITGRFDSADGLDITEPDNLQCSDSSFIYRRTIACRLREDGGAGCVVEQPGLDTRDEIRLRRAAGEP